MIFISIHHIHKEYIEIWSIIKYFHKKKEPFGSLFTNYNTPIFLYQNHIFDYMVDSP